MANYNDLKTAVAAVIKQNGNQEITGDVLQNTLKQIISSVGMYADFAGIATPTTNPGTPDQNLYYIATQPGTYTAFGDDKVINETGKVYYLKSDGSGGWQMIDATTASSDGMAKKVNGFYAPEAYNILPEFAGVIDLWIESDSAEIPADMELYLYFLAQSPTPDVTRTTMYIKKGTGGIIGSAVTDIVAMLPNQTNAPHRTDVVTYITKPYPGNTDGIKLGITIDWSLVNPDTFRTTNYAKLNINALRLSAEERKSKQIRGVRKTVFPFLTADSDVSLLEDFGIYGITMTGTPAADIETMGIGYIGYDDVNAPDGIRLYFIKNNTVSNNGIIATGFIATSDIKHGIMEIRCSEYNSSGVNFIALIDGYSFLRKKLIMSPNLRLKPEGFYNPGEYVTLSEKWQGKGLIETNVNMQYAQLPGIIDVKLLYDRDGYLKNNPVYFWAYGNYIDTRNRPNRYIYFTKEKYVSWEQSVVCHSVITGYAGAVTSTETEKFIVREQNNSGLAFIVTIDWSKIRNQEIDNSIWIPVNPNIPVAVADNAKQTYFIPDAARLHKIVDGFILDMKMNKRPNMERLAVWYITNETTDRRVYIGVMTPQNTIMGASAGIYAMYVGSGSSNQIEDITLTPLAKNGADTTFSMRVDWSKIPEGYNSQTNNEQLGCVLNLDNIPIVSSDPSTDENFVIANNMPILPSQIFLRNDVTTPMFKNSLFTTMQNLERVDVNLICNVGDNGSRVVPINEPTEMGGVDGVQIKPGSARMFLGRTSDYTQFVFKDMQVFLKDVSMLSGKTVKILSLGDSLTEGSDWSNTPVCMLADELTKIGVTTQFIGTLARNFVNKQGQTVKLNYEGRGGWRYRTMTGLESMFAGLDVVIPTDLTKHEWMLGVDGSTMNKIKANHSFMYPATNTDKQNYPEFCYHFVVGNNGYNQSYADDPNLGDYIIFDPIRYFSERSVDIPDILTIAFGTNEWYLGGFDLPAASKAFKFMVQQFRRASSTMKIAVIPANALNMRRQNFWGTEAGILTAEIIRVIDELRTAGDANLYVCPIYAQSSRWLGWDNLVTTPVPIAPNYDTMTATISQDVHSLYVDDESNNQYAKSLAACAVNLID